MYNHRIYADGIEGILHVTWKVRCKTPLAIRNGLTLRMKEAQPIQVKERNRALVFEWEPQPDREHQRQYMRVNGLAYGYRVHDSRVISEHGVPPSSVRGALRGWTITRLLAPELHSAMMPPPNPVERADAAGLTTQVTSCEDEQLTRVRQALAGPPNAFQVIASLFGQAFDSRDADLIQANAGRLRLETTLFANADVQPIKANGQVSQGIAGPANAYRQLVPRNPIDHLTQAARQGGIHHWLEFCANQTFTVCLAITNPQATDLGLLSLWKRELNAGLLRLGALTSIGRGRVAVEHEEYALWRRPGSQVQETALAGFLPDTAATNDILADFWEPWTLAPSKLTDFEDALRPLLSGSTVN